MLYAWIGFLRPGLDSIPAAVEESSTDFLAQPLIRIRAAGPLRDGLGKRAGMMLVFEHDSLDDAASFVRSSPYLGAGLYEDHRLYEFTDWIGS